MARWGDLKPGPEKGRASRPGRSGDSEQLGDPWTSFPEPGAEVKESGALIAGALEDERLSVTSGLKRSFARKVVERGR
jgi:hypothetical protein